MEFGRLKSREEKRVERCEKEKIITRLKTDDETKGIDHEAEASMMEKGDIYRETPCFSRLFCVG